MRFSVHDGPGIRTTVFFKGCPLRCRWCHNPESQAFGPTLLYFEDRCRHCGECVRACPHGSPCRACGACVEVCAAGARQLAGREMSPAQVMREIEKDRVFYEESGGGATLSGGEPLSQPEFAAEVLAACRRAGIHTALDTCGFAPRETLLRVAALADLVLYDLKTADGERHAEYTGVSNAGILGNLEALAAARRPVIVRYPLIPGVNDGPGELAAAAAIVKGLGLPRIDVLPYHRTGMDKYRRLGRSYGLAGVAVPSVGDLDRAAEPFRGAGLSVSIGGGR